MIDIDNMIQLAHEEKERNRKLRHEIIDDLMEIYNTESLEIVHRFSRLYSRQEAANHVMSLDEAINLMEIEDIVALHKLVKDKSDQLIANSQITKICEDVINGYKKWEDEEIDKKGIGEVEGAAAGD